MRRELIEHVEVLAEKILRTCGENPDRLSVREMMWDYWEDARVILLDDQEEDDFLEYLYHLVRNSTIKVILTKERL